MNPIQQKLFELRTRLSRWLIVHGLGRWVMTGLLVIGASILLDRVFKMDFAQRSIVLVVMIGTAVAYFYWLVIRPLLRRANDDSLILEVERKNPQLRENLISSWQLGHQVESGELALSGASESLAAATIETGLAKAREIDFSQALDLSEHRKDWMLLLTGLLASMGLALGIWQTDFLQTWFRRNVLLTNDSWPQSTYLKIEGAVDGRLAIPRGADHRQLVFVTEDSSVKDVKVTLEMETSGGRTLQQMKPTGKLEGREHASVLYNVSTRFRFRASGGDDVTEWVEVDLVEPPVVVDLNLRATLPEYTGVTEVELAGSGPHAVLGGSTLNIEISTNKPLRSATLKRGASADVYEEIAFQSLNSADDERYGLTLNPDQLLGGDYGIHLVDETGLENLRPTKFTMTIKNDQPPQVRASLLGISGLVVPRARLPVSYHAVDEYGLASLLFDAQWVDVEANESSQAEPQAANIPIVTLGKDIEANPIKEVSDVQVLDLESLKLTPGMSFRFSVAAEDICPNPAGIGNSQQFLLRVVTNEELRGDLLRREIEQRKAFEQAYEKQMELASELQIVTVKPREPSQTELQYRAQREADMIGLIRNQKAIGTSIAQVADRFEEFLVEIKNNRLDEAENELFPGQTIESRFDGKIIQPIRRLDAELISLAARHMDQCRMVVSQDSELYGVAEQAALVHQQILEEMKKIMSAMSDSENFQEVINDLLRIKDDSSGLKKEIEKKTRSKDIFDE